jgi:chromosome segregation ATPase
MPSTNEPISSDDIFRKLEAILGELRTAATAPPERPASWAKRAFKSAPDSARQSGFNLALVDALAETLDVLRAAVANQENRLEEIAREMSEVRATSENLDAFRERSDRLEAELRSAAANVRALQERSAALETALAQSRDEQAARIQHLLDEQRVCIRQLSLQASEEAVLADRARRATELKLEELARRIAPPPA